MDEAEERADMAESAVNKMRSKARDSKNWILKVSVLSNALWINLIH